MRQLAVALALVVLVVAVMGTTRGVDRERYVAANEALLDELPSYPGAVRSSVRSSPYYAGDAAWSPVAGYTTLALFRLPPPADPRAIATFFELALRSRGWTLVERVDGPELNFQRKGSSVSVNLESWRAGVLEIAVDRAGG